MSRPFPARASYGGPAVRLNGKIRAREVRVLGEDNQQIGILSLAEAIRRAQSLGVDLVEIAAEATPPVCRLVDYGKYRYELSKKERDARKPQQASKLKEIQLRATIGSHDFSIKLGHAMEFLREGMKVKVALRFRGREMLHQEFGMKVVETFVKDLAAYGQPDAPPKLTGRALNVMLRPLSRHQRGKHDHPGGGSEVTKPQEPTS